jgi:NAD(P)-dependent dehydrogenase (short-subunit alcohol dehydrogenase family)
MRDVRTIVVTGSASGIGQAARERLERDGCRVIGVDLREAEVVADLATPYGRAALVEGVQALTPAIDGVVACAGVEVMDAVTVRVNYFGTVATLEGLRPLLAAGELPRAVAVASQSSLQPFVDPAIVDACLDGDEERAVAASEEALAGEGTRPRAVYASSKRALCLWVRREAPTPPWASAGIPLNAVAPGIIETPMTRPYLDDPEKRAGIHERVPMPLHGPGKPEHVASLLTWLVSPENVLVTGQVVFVDGGADAVMRGITTW